MAFFGGIELFNFSAHLFDRAHRHELAKHYSPKPFCVIFFKEKKMAAVEAALIFHDAFI